jgi:hypothetical protein
MCRRSGAKTAPLIADYADDSLVEFRPFPFGGCLSRKLEASVMSRIINLTDNPWEIAPEIPRRGSFLTRLSEDNEVEKTSVSGCKPL